MNFDKLIFKLIWAYEYERKIKKTVKRQATKRDLPKFLKIWSKVTKILNIVLAEKYAISLMAHTRKIVKSEGMNYIVKMTFQLVRIRILFDE